MTQEFDVVIVGAGLSGVGAAYHLQKQCSAKSFVLLEARERLGGTWDLFRYPGIRSDSDMHTLGYSFRPWTNAKAIADGPSILEYVRKTAEDYGIDRKIRFGKRVEKASFSRATSRWTLQVRDLATDELQEFRCAFLLMCAGYYDYDQGHNPEFPGRERFQGKVVHPQFWPEDLNYDHQRVVVIGSGATAVTLVPAMAKRAEHVTMLQRSPTYIVSAPEQDVVANWLRERLPEDTAYTITRWKNVIVSMGLYKFCRSFPEKAREVLTKQVERQLRGSKTQVDPHFVPTYNPWDQRLCLVPNGDLFRAIRKGRADVVTDHIETFTEHGIRLKSGRELEADIIVTATGLKLKFLGGVTLDIDGKPIEMTEAMTYRGLMCSDVPNLAFAVGYTNASWTLKVDLAFEYFCRVLNYMAARGYTQFEPRRNDPKIKRAPLIDLQSGYVERAAAQLPSQGSKSPWKLYQNYALDYLLLRKAPLEDGALTFSRA